MANSTDLKFAQNTKDGDYPYYYMATVQKPTAITKCIRANFTCRKSAQAGQAWNAKNEAEAKLAEDAEMKEQINSSSKQEQQPVGDYVLEDNLIFAQSDSLRIFTYESDAGKERLQLRSEFALNDQVLDIIRIPTTQFGKSTQLPQEETPQKGRNQKQKQSLNGAATDPDLVAYPQYLPMDMLFVLTKGLHCLLLGFKKETQRAELISKGYLHDQNCVEREPPFPVFLSSNKKFIGLMLSDNVLKIIPLVKNAQTKVQLSAAFNVRIMHPDVNLVVPLACTQGSSQHIGVFILHKKFNSSGRAINQPKYKLIKYRLDMVEQELVALEGAKDCAIEFVCKEVYHIEPLPFGGFLAFDPEHVYFYADESDKCIDARQLRKPIVASAVAQVDEYDPVTGQTTQGTDFMRYLVGTEGGELYMVAFHLQVIKELTQSGQRTLAQVNSESAQLSSIMCVEFLGARLSCCSSLQYLGGNGLAYYASKSGDSYILQIQSTRQNSEDKESQEAVNPSYNPDLEMNDRPYLKIIEEHQSLAPIVDMQLRDTSFGKQGPGSPTSAETGTDTTSRKGRHQNELLVVSGSNYTSHINIIRKGISIKDHITIEQLPAIQAEGGLNCVRDKMFLRVYGIPQLLVAKISIMEDQGNRGLQISEIDTARALQDIEEGEEILLMREVCSGSILIITDQRIRVASEDLESVLFERLFDDSIITACDIQNDFVLVALDDGKLVAYSVAKDRSGLLTEIGCLDLGFEVTCLAITADGRYACVSLCDMPLYSLYILELDQASEDDGIKILEQRSLLSILEYEAYQDMLTNTLLAKDTTSTTADDQEMEDDSAEKQRDDQLTVQQMYDGVQYLNCNLPCAVARSLKILTAKSDYPSTQEPGLSYIVCTFGDGRTLTMSFDHGEAKAMASKEEPFDQRLKHVARSESGRSDKSSSTALGDYQILSIGTVEPTLRSLIQPGSDAQGGDTHSVLVCCDRPALFYLAGDRLEMQYLREDLVNQACMISVKLTSSQAPDQMETDLAPSLQYVSMIAYENLAGKIVVGTIEPQTKLQARRMGFKKQVNKAVIIQGEELLLANMEEPDYGFLDPNRQDTNLLALLSKQTFKTLDTFHLQRYEVANCTLQVDKRVSGQMGSQTTSTRNQPLSLVLVGTAFLDEETLPARGRLLIFRVDAKECRLELLHELQCPGSIQAIGTLKDHKYLTLAMNNRVVLYSFNMKLGNQFDLIEHDSKVSGTFAQSMKTIDNQIVVGDMMKGVMVFDVKEGRQNKVTLCEGPSSCQINVWVNEILILSKERYLVVDRDKNIFIFQRNLKPTNEIQKFKLTVVAQINSGEEITSAIVGSINNQESLLRAQSDQSPRSGHEAQSLPMRKRRTTQTIDEKLTETTQTEGNVQLKSSQDYVRQVCSIALKHVQEQKQENYQSIVYGTQEGSLGQLTQIPKYAYLFLTRLSEVMQERVRGISRVSLKEYRQIKLDATNPQEPKNIIDGDYIEQFLDIDERVQAQIAQSMLLNTHDMSQAYLLEVKQLIQLMQQKH